MRSICGRDLRRRVAAGGDAQRAGGAERGRGRGVGGPREQRRPERPVRRGARPVPPRTAGVRARLRRLHSRSAASRAFALAQSTFTEYV